MEPLTVQAIESLKYYVLLYMYMRKVQYLDKTKEMSQ
jgi:hypothetical protein